jgi:ureidoacrylate peracid hydrolase
LLKLNILLRQVQPIGKGGKVAQCQRLPDGFFLEYFGVVLEDATHQAGPEFAQKAALFNIETFFGWVSDVESFCDALSPASLARIA